MGIEIAIGDPSAHHHSGVSQVQPCFGLSEPNNWTPSGADEPMEVGAHVHCTTALCTTSRHAV